MNYAFNCKKTFTISVHGNTGILRMPFSSTRGDPPLLENYSRAAPGPQHTPFPRMLSCETSAFPPHRPGPVPCNLSTEEGVG